MRHPVATLITACLGLVMCCASACEDKNPSRPSIVLLIADDLGRAALYGSNRPTTPNLEQLAREGMRFDAAFTTTALCIPSRMALFTGRYPDTSRLRGFDAQRRDLPLLHETLGSQGYRTGLVGKFSTEIEESRPFDFFVGAAALAGGADVGAIAEQAGRFLDEVGDRPFLLVIAFKDPHAPYPDRPACTPDKVEVPGDLPDLPGVRIELTHYYAAVERLDRGVGLVLEQLKRAGRERETMVVFLSDNGPAFPFAKSTLYDAGVHVPLIVRWPETVRPSTTTDELVSFVDVQPTILEAAGIEAPTAVHGRSFLPLLRGERATRPRAVFLSHGANLEGNFPMRGVRTAQYKYIRNFAPELDFGARLEMRGVWRAMLEAASTDDAVAERVAFYRERPAEELYAVTSDPFELHNRIDDPALASEVQQHRELLSKWMSETGDAP